jgi:lactoylglutathione lyase
VTPYERVDYVILYVRDLDRSISFYRDVIGLPFKFTESGYAEFATEGTKFALYDRAGLPALIGREGTDPEATMEVAFLVGDVDVEARRLTEAGVSVLSGPLDRPWGQRTFHLLDPDGHVVELAQDLPADQRGD